MKKRLLTLCVVVLAIVGGTLYILFTSAKDDTVNNPSANSKSPNGNITREDITKFIAKKSDDFEVRYSSDALVVEYAIFHDEWIVTRILATEEPMESESRRAIYILKNTNKSLQLIAHSSNSFSHKDSIPAEIPQELMERIYELQ